MSYSKFAPPKNPHKLTSYVFKYPKQFTFQAIAGIAFNTFIVLSPIMIGRTIDAAKNLHDGTGTIHYFLLQLFLYFGVTVFFQVARYFKRWFMRDLTNKIACDMRSGLLSSAFDKTMFQLEQEKIGDLISRTIGDVEQVIRFMRVIIVEMWDTWLLMISYFVACCFYDVKITLLATIPIPIVILIAESMRHPLYHLTKSSRQLDSKISVHLQRTLNGISILRLFGRENDESEKLKKLTLQQMKLSVKVTVLQNALVPIYFFIATTGLLVIIGFGGDLVKNHKWTIGMFTAYINMFIGMTQRTNTIAKTFNGWHGAKASWNRILEKMNNNGNNNEKEVAMVAPNNKNLTIQNMSFQFPTGNSDVIQNISYEIPFGKIICITGSVGSGKSALASALSGMYPYAGSIKIGDTELSTLGNARPKIISYMDENHFLFKGEIGYNITFNHDLTEEETEKLSYSLHMSGLAEDVPRFPEGLKTIVGERGTRVSGGQRQRVALSRAFYSNADILILDDPFSAVDIATESRIIERLKEANEGTIIIFSHRLAAFSMADDILVLDKGKIVQQGKHEDLLQQAGIYKSIYSAQKFMTMEDHHVS